MIECGLVVFVIVVINDVDVDCVFGFDGIG